ncbi:MAG: hypothetical protein CW338_10080 [Clostridiales bacterium]|nr:hypothetical protein [Clostridiales bacterium]
MSYCVHCGVKLERSEGSCPLCGTRIIDPAAEETADAVQPPYPVHNGEQILRKSKKNLLQVAGALTLIPAAICILLDLVISGRIRWSLYAAAALCILFGAFALPLMHRKHRFLVSMIFLACAGIGYLYMISRLVGGGWFLPVAMPSVLIGCGFIYFFVLWIRRRHPGKFAIGGVFFISAGCLCITVETLLLLFFRPDVFAYHWSPFAAAPTVFIGILLLVTDHDKDLMDELRRRLHY